MRSFLLLALLAVSTSPAHAQYHRAPDPGSFNSGIKLRGNLHFTQTRADVATEMPRGENAYGAGLEIIGRRLGMGVYGFAPGRTEGFEAERTAVHVALEANYFHPMERIRLAPYVGVHSGLGSFTRDYFADPHFPRPRDGRRDLGYQAGIRFKPIPLIGLDAQWRRQSRSITVEMGEMLERDQFMVGVVLF
jgi:hypothetical protein